MGDHRGREDRRCDHESEVCGEWIKWEAAMQIDKRWHSLLAYESDSALRFWLCATEDQLPTLSMLQRWGQGDGMCPLGCKAKGSLRHILYQCQIDETPCSRIAWRHDSILLAIFKAVLRTVNRYKNTYAKEKRNPSCQTNQAISFVTESKTKYKALRAPKVKDLLDQASDWQLQFDLDAPEYHQIKERMFPSEIVEADKRPDGVLWSCSSKMVIWIELTSPWEENMAMWHDQKKTDYTQLRLDCENKGWKVYPLYVEVGCRGHVSQSFHYMCKVLGFSKQEEKELKFCVEKTAQQCSHAIFCHRYQKVWEKRALVDISKWQC